MRPVFRSDTLFAALVLAALTAAGSAPIGAQSLVDPVIRAGTFRVSGGAQFHGWRERFDVDGEREALAADLTRDSGAELFPGVARLQADLEQALGASFPLRLGASSGLVSHNEVRVPLSVDVGVFDRLTVGVTVPLVRTLLEADWGLESDDTADLGLNPTLSDPTGVTAFWNTLGSRAADAQALASSLCGQDPASAGCTSATALAADLQLLHTNLGGAYSASALFPAVGTDAGAALVGRIAAVDAELQAQGLQAIGLAPPLAAGVADLAALQALLEDPSGPFRASPIESFGGLWGLGDVEARAAVRLLAGERVDSAGLPTLSWRLSAVGTVRLPTGSADTTGIFLARGRDDGQLDVEASAFAAVATRRFAVRARATWLLQQSAEIQARIAPLGQVISGAGDVATLDWDPGDGLRFDVEPSFLIAPTLSLGLLWSWTSLGADSYAYAVQPVVREPFPLGVNSRYFPDPSLLGQGTEVELQEIGGSLTYRTVDLPENGGSGFEAFIRVRQALSGSGGRVPAGLRGEFGLRIVRRAWGG